MYLKNDNMMEPNGSDLHLEEIVHDQLPSVEEYKASSGFKSSASFRPDPAGSQVLFRYPVVGLSYTSDLVDQDDLEHRELVSDGTVLAEKALVNDSSRFWKCFGIGSFVAFILVIVLGVTLPQRNKNSTTSWLQDSDRYAAVEQYLISVGISKANDLFAEQSPQHVAAKWLANKDGMRLPIPVSTTSRDHATFVERYVLVVLYYATGGPEWTHQLNFLKDNHVCTWYQPFTVDSPDAKLDGDFVTLGVHGCKMVGDELVPFTLFMPNNNLVGSLPEEMQYLDRLEILNLQFNGDLGGPLPRALVEMSMLRHIGFQWCNFTGTIPTWIGKLTQLDYLGLGNNQLTGSVPDELTKLENLELLGLDDNDLSANIELFHTLKGIKSLYLEDNQFTGSISNALLASWPDLQELDLSNNELSGSLPDDFFNHVNDLRVIDLSKNKFEGVLPMPSLDNFKVEFLALDDNKFEATIPDSINRFKRVSHLDLSGNDFISTLPGSMGQLTQLEYLFVGNNPFESAGIPPFLIELTNLRDLSLKSSRLEGTIPAYISQLTNLEFFDLHYNQLTGTIPGSIGKLSALKHLLLKSNKLSGLVPTEIDQLSNLDVLLLEQNSLVGDADAICKKENFSLQLFVSDCNNEGFQCSCCDICCSIEDPTCNAGEWDGSIDPIWEYGFRRGRYSYNMGPYIVVVP